MTEPQKLGEIISELMQLFTERHELEQQIKQDRASEADVDHTAPWAITGQMD